MEEVKEEEPVRPRKEMVKSLLMSSTVASKKGAKSK